MLRGARMLHRVGGVARRAGQCRYLSSSVRLDSFATEAGSSAAPSYTPSIVERILNCPSAPRVPLSDVYPGVVVPNVRTLPELSERPQISTLPNGLRVATLPNHSPVSSFGVFIDCGSRYETSESSGITHFMELMSLKTTHNRSDFKLARDTLGLGITLATSASREHMIYSAECLKEVADNGLETLADVIQHNAFHPQELMEMAEYCEKSIEEREKSVEITMMEAIHEAAYNNSSLGLPLYPPVHNIPNFTCEAMTNYTQTFFTPKRMVISAVGIDDHAAFVQQCAHLFEDLPADMAIEKQEANYTGGEVRLHNRKITNGLTTIALAFETASWHSTDLVPMCILQLLMGGGGSFSAGGPGKGMYSRVYRNILSVHEWAEQAIAFNSIFTDSSLFGMYGSSHPSKAQHLIEAMAKELNGMAGPIADDELLRAKNALKSSVYMQLESRVLKLEDIGRQVMTYGKVTPPSELAAQIDAVTAADLQRVAKKLLSTPLSLAALGDLSYVPRYDVIQRLFKN